jgi:hypothetical protein
MLRFEQRGKLAELPHDLLHFQKAPPLVGNEWTGCRPTGCSPDGVFVMQIYGLPQT